MEELVFEGAERLFHWKKCEIRNVEWEGRSAAVMNGKGERMLCLMVPNHLRRPSRGLSRTTRRRHFQSDPRAAGRSMIASR